MASEITNPIFIGIIQDMNRQMQPRKKATTKKYTIYEAPQVAEEELLDALIARHKGKVQSVSYTHLDVYKRQLYIFVILFQLRHFLLNKCLQLL